jgi:hypothetical protein
VKPFVLRDEDPPDDAVVVIRGGEMESDSVRRSAERNHDAFGFYGISVFVAVDQPVRVLCANLGQIARYSKVRLSTAGRLRSEAFPIIPTLDRPHFDIVLPDLEHRTLARLDGCFGPPQPNPGRP